MIKWFRKEEDTNSANKHQLEKKEQKGLFSKLKSGLQKTRKQLSSKLDSLIKGKTVIDEELYEELEEMLITCDVGVDATLQLIDRLKSEIKLQKIENPQELYHILQREIATILDISSSPLDPTTHKPFVVMVVGVNGVGKTTTIAKLAHFWKSQGLKPLLVAGDTFRAAAIDQLTLWAEKIGVPIVKQQPGADPAAVAYDALESAIAKKLDIVIIDTAGRMHTKTNLMEELKKIRRVIAKKVPDAPHETLLVLDATTGQNAISQTKMFKENTDISGIILTKLDGTAKGGIIIGICHVFQIPVRFIGIGEGLEDLRPFDPEAFAKALLETDNDE